MEELNIKTSKTLMRDYTAEYTEELMHAHENGKKVAWVNGLFPQEFLEAMDIVVAYPENLAAVLGAKNGVTKYLKKSDSLGYSNDLCSYTRAGLGYIEDFDSDVSNIPRPDIILNCTNICGLCVKWFENTAKRLNVPYLLIDTPFQTQCGATENDVDYIVAQFEELIRQLEIFCGKPFDRKRFHEICGISKEVARAWRRVNDFSYYNPSPLDGFNLFNFMVLAVCQRSRQTTVEVFDLFAEELQQLAKEQKSQFKGEQRHRIMWDGIACWPYLGQNHKAMRSLGMIMTGSFYPEEWILDFDKDDVRSLARAYANRPPISSVQKQIDIRTKIMNDAECDGALYLVNRSCKILAFMQAAVREGVYERTGKPYTTFDGDQTDPSAFSEAQFNTRIQALSENIDNCRQIAKGGADS